MEKETYKASRLSLDSIASIADMFAGGADMFSDSTSGFAKIAANLPSLMKRGNSDSSFSREAKADIPASPKSEVQTVGELVGSW